MELDVLIREIRDMADNGDAYIDWRQEFHWIADELDKMVANEESNDE